MLAWTVYISFRGVLVLMLVAVNKYVSASAKLTLNFNQMINHS